MAKIITSDSVVFMDNTDNRKLDVYITSNLPTVQIKNSNTNPVAYTPNWASTPLVLKANAYLDSEDVTSKTTFVWYKKDVNGIETQISTTTNAQVIISNNADLDNNQLIVYICKAVYKASEVDSGIEDTEQITFSQVTTGLNGTSGTSAPAVQAQYSANGVNGWTTTLDTTIHKYVRHSYDGGKTYTVAMKMVGEDGTSVVIKGTAYTSDTLISGQVVRLFSDSNKTTLINTSGLSTGDSYLVSGYLCVYNKTNDNFVCTGTIQGPQGVPGQNNYMYIRYSENSNGADMRETPTSSTIYIGVCISTSSKAPDTPNLYTWSKFVGDSAKSIILSGSSQIFKVTQGTSLKYEPSTILVSAQAINTTVAKWEYSANGGLDWVALDPLNLPGGIEFGSSQNTLMITGSELDSNTLVIRASNGEYKDVYTVYKVFDGVNGSVGAKGEDAPIAFLTNENISIAANANGVINNTSTLRIVTGVAAYIGATKQIPTLGAIIDKPSDMNISIEDDATLQEKKLTISFNSNATLGSTNSNSGTITIPVTYPVVTNLKLSWSKINTGANGQKGDKGEQLYTWIKYADTPTSGMSDKPDGKTYIGLAYNKDTAQETDNYNDYMWSLIKGETGPVGPKGEDGQQYYTWIKYADDVNGTNMDDSPNGKLYIGLAYNKTTSTESNVATDYTWALFKGDKGDKGDTGSAGRGVSSIVEQYYQSTSATSQANGSWATTVPTWVDGKYIWTRSVITYTDTTTYTTSPICVTGQKGGTGGTGAAGVGVSSIDVWYYHSTSATALSGGSWATTAPTWSDGKYVWTKTITTYTNNTTDETAAVCITGQKGSTGVGIKSVAEYYLATASSSGVTISTTGWTTAIQTITADKKYLWNYEIITYTDNTTSTTTPIIIGVFGNTGATGATGKGIKSITEYYLATTASSGVSTTTSGWTPTMQTLTATNKYLWNYELITYTDNSTATINPVIIGVYGDRGAQGAAGADAYTVLLTNESHVFAGSTSAAVASSAATQILAYKGTAAQTVTIVSVNGVAAATASTATGIAGLSFACSALSGTSPTITFTCTTSFVSPSGTIPIVLSVGGISITKMFAYSIAFKGATGGTGAASSSYWLVSNADTVQKTSNGDILCTPATLTFTGKSKTGSGAPADYAGRWIIAYSTDGIAYTNAYTSTANEASASLTASPSYKAVRARMYLAGGTTTLLDEQIIPFVSDGAVGASGVDAVTFQIYSSNGYALSTSTPTVTLQTFAYIGDVAITAGATYQWYTYSNTGWTAVAGATNQYLVVSRDDVVFSKSYMCKMTFNGAEYTSVATIDDKNDDNKVFTSKPSNYVAGDIWIVSVDYVPSGVEVGTLLRAEHTNTSYADNDWITAMKYDEKLNQLQESLEKYNQYFSFDSTDGLKIGAKDASGTPSKFSTSLTNERLSFNYGNESIAYINGTKMNIKEAEIESPLTITGKYSGSTMLQAPVINIGNFSIIVESNGSLSIVANI